MYPAYVDVKNSGIFLENPEYMSQFPNNNFLPSVVSWTNYWNASNAPNAPNNNN